MDESAYDTRRLSWKAKGQSPMRKRAEKLQTEILAATCHAHNAILSCAAKSLFVALTYHPALTGRQEFRVMSAVCRLKIPNGLSVFD